MADQLIHLPPKPTLTSEVEQSVKLFPFLAQIPEKDLRKVLLYMVTRGIMFGTREAGRKLSHLLKDYDEDTVGDIKLHIYNIHPGDVINGLQ